MDWNYRSVLGLFFEPLGRPTFPGISRIISTTEGSNIFVRPTFLTGFTSALRNWTFTVSKGLFSISAISCVVNSFIIPVSVYFSRKLSHFKGLLHKRLVEFLKKVFLYTDFGLYILTIYRYRYIY